MSKVLQACRAKLLDILFIFPISTGISAIFNFFMKLKKIKIKIAKKMPKW
jgi:hypothetical protein